jgi:hypothetical protein
LELGRNCKSDALIPDSSNGFDFVSASQRPMEEKRCQNHKQANTSPKTSRFISGRVASRPNDETLHGHSQNRHNGNKCTEKIAIILFIPRVLPKCRHAVKLYHYPLFR